MKIFKKIFPQKPFIPYETFGENGLKELVQNFYQIMESDPAAKDCLNTHRLVEGKVPEEVKEKLFDFLSGWMGGPNLFIQKHGHPRMRARHMGVRIDSTAKDQWLYCMDKAMDMSSVKMKKKQREMMFNSFTALAHRIQNV